LEQKGRIIKGPQKVRLELLQFNRKFKGQRRGGKQGVRDLRLGWANEKQSPNDRKLGGKKKSTTMHHGRRCRLRKGQTRGGKVDIEGP